MDVMSWLGRPNRARANAEKLYGAIVAQSRLPAFYADLGVPDSLEGRFLVLSMHVFAALERLKQEGAGGLPLGQELIDVFSRDMDTVLRELGVSDLRVPKKVRALCASNHGLMRSFEAAIASEDAEALAATFSELLPVEAGSATVGRALSTYVKAMMSHLSTQPATAIEAGRIDFPEVSK